MFYLENPYLTKLYKRPSFDITTCPTFTVSNDEKAETQTVECLKYTRGKVYSDQASLGEISLKQDCQNCTFNKTRATIEHLGGLTIISLEK